MGVSSHPGSRRKALRPSALWFVGLAAMLYFPTLGPTLGLGVTQSFQYAGLVDAWWVISLVLMAIVDRLLLHRTDVGTVPIIVAHTTCVIAGWLVMLPVADMLGIDSAWLRTAGWLPAAALVVACVSAVIDDRREFADERLAADADLAVLESQTRAITEAHARIVEEARSQSRLVTDAVRAAMRMAQDDTLHNRDLRRLLDSELRDQARAASHRVHDLTPEQLTGGASPSRHPLRQWLDTLSSRPIRRGLLGILLAGTATVPGVLIVHGLTDGIRVAALCLASAIAVSALLLLLARARAPRTSARRVIFLGSFILGSAALIAPSVLLASGISPRDAVITVVLAMPALACIALLPVVLSASVERRSALRAEMRAEIELSTLRRDSAAQELEQARRAVVSTLHTHVQGRAAAAITAMDLAEAGVPGTRDMVEAILAELADLDIDVDPGPRIDTADPIDVVLNCWSGVLRIDIRTDDLESLPTRFTAAEHLQNLLMNAVVHGGAHAAIVELRGEDTLAIRVEDDGDGPPRELVEGLGLGRVRESQGTWTLTRRADHTVVELTVPVLVPRSRREARA